MDKSAVHAGKALACHTLPLITASGLNKGTCCTLSVSPGHGILGDKSAVHAGKALARHIFSGLLRNKHLIRMEQQDVFDELEASVCIASHFGGQKHLGVAGLVPKAAQKEAAFKKANKAANSVYDNPPRTVNYISHGGKMATYELATHEDGMQVYKEQGKVSGGPVCICVRDVLLFKAASYQR
eukprot:1160075-Pelagomonas_calceolata.AAC.7